MSNGITAAIYEGKDVSRDEFLVRVARSFSLAIMQREDDPDAPVRRDKANTEYHDGKIAAAQQLLAELSDMSLDEAQERAKTEYKESEARLVEQRNKTLAVRSRYEAMIREVEAWEPEPLVAYLKEGALKYLRESIDFDCGKPGEETKYWLRVPYRSGGEWIGATASKARKDIDYHRAEIAKRRKLAAERNEHIDAFYRSLTQPTKESTSEMGCLDEQQRVEKLIERLREQVPPEEPCPSDNDAGRARRQYRRDLIEATDLLAVLTQPVPEEVSK